MWRSTSWARRETGWPSVSFTLCALRRAFSLFNTSIFSDWGFSFARCVGPTGTCAPVCWWHDCPAPKPFFPRFLTWLYQHLWERIRCQIYKSIKCCVYIYIYISIYTHTRDVGRTREKLVNHHEPKATVLSTSQVVYHAGKPIESVLYCFYKITMSLPAQ